ncbi:hypothetical protein G7Y89_g13246 [Cudoniella acicularis]|uniref:Nudix hydrolase domain-containing protein n=1 Tax=Cudoniella acicularis TaxID=354080 RepID=A0A8H4R8M2_9HELO|nr:hypothetical protein G7Y89_g13246 [Cudoniella acicularis]
MFMTIHESYASGGLGSVFSRADNSNTVGVFVPDDFDFSKLYRLLLPQDPRPHGFMLPSIVSQMPWSSDFVIDHDLRTVALLDSSNGANTGKTCCAAFQKVIDAAITANTFSILHGEHSEMYKVVGAKQFTCLERFAAPLFGIGSLGAHMTAYVRTPSGLKIWVARRSAHLFTYPGMLDTTVAGGVKADHSPFDCILAEADEEASIPVEYVQEKAHAVGIVSYVTENRKTGLISPTVLYNFDIELPETIVPQPKDDEVEGFYLWSVEEVQQAMLRKEFKPNCNLVMIDFFIRHGIMIQENQDDYIEIVNRLTRSSTAPTTAQNNNGSPKVSIQGLVSESAHPQFPSIKECRQTSQIILPGADESDHGYSPIYNPEDWPKTLNVTDNAYMGCYEFPDGTWWTSMELRGGIRHGDPHEVFCWQSRAINGTDYLKSVAGCYINEEDIADYSSDPAVKVGFEDVLPWCGPRRPYEVWSIPDSLIVYDVYSNSQYDIPCYTAPRKNATKLMTAGLSPHTYCQVEGEVFTNSSRWYESALRERGENCYFPQDYFPSSTSEISEFYPLSRNWEIITVRRVFMAVVSLLGTCYKISTTIETVVGRDIASPVSPQLDVESGNIQRNTMGFAFEGELESSWVYKRSTARGDSGTFSVISAAGKSASWSMLSGLTLAACLTVIAVQALSLYATDISNSESYTFGDLDVDQTSLGSSNRLSTVFGTKRVTHDPDHRRVFGVPLHESIVYVNFALSSLHENGNSYIYGHVPLIIAKIGVYIKENGVNMGNVFGKSGSATRIQEIETIFDSPDRYDENDRVTTDCAEQIAAAVQPNLLSKPAEHMTTKDYAPATEALVFMIYHQAQIVLEMRWDAALDTDPQGDSFEHGSVARGGITNSPTTIKAAQEV